MSVTTQAIAEKLYTEVAQNLETEPELMTYIQKIAKDTLFQTDPKKYVKNWNEARGATEMFRYPDDEAISIVKKFLDTHLPGWTR